jgi:ATP-dependent DNA ligase
MLARIYSPQLWTEVTEAYIQPKYNGVRAIATITAAEGGQVIFYSRKGNLYPGLDYIGAELIDMLSAYWQEDRQLYLDGELFLPEMPLQMINSYARNSQKPGGMRPKYYIYDLFIANEPQLSYVGRKALLTEIFEDFLAEAQSSVLVNTYEIHNHEQAQTHYEAFLAAGFEGAIVRLNSVYSHSYNDYRSPALLKMKPTLDAEFEIVGYLAGAKGKTLGALIMVCKNEAGLVFNVTPALEIAERKRLFTKMAEIDPINQKTYFENNYLGKKLIVEFAEWSIDRVPQQPRTSMVLREWD